MEVVATEVKDVAVLKRLLFATAYLSSETPHYWEIVTRFACRYSDEKAKISPETARITMESLQCLDSKAFCMETDLIKELVSMEYGKNKQQLGIPLIPKQMICLLCKGKLLLRSDRSSKLTLYTNTLGTVSASHYHKYCSNFRKGCKFVQYYGYSKHGDIGTTKYDSDWIMLPYFISSQETGFEMTLLKNFDVELLIGQVSYKQRADIYNVCNGIAQRKNALALKEKTTWHVLNRFMGEFNTVVALCTCLHAIYL